MGSKNETHRLRGVGKVAATLFWGTGRGRGTLALVWVREQDPDVGKCGLLHGLWKETATLPRIRDPENTRAKQAF